MIVKIVTITFLGFLVHSSARLTIPLLLADIQVPLIYIGIVMTAHYVVTAALSIPLGLASDRIGRKKTITISFAIMLISTLILAVARDLPSVFVAFTLMAVGWAAFDPSVTAMVGDLAKSNELGRAYGTLAATIQAGFSLGPAFAGLLITLFGFNAPFIISAPILLLTIIFLNWTLRLDSKAKSVMKEDNIRHLVTTLSHKKPVLAGWVAIVSSFVITGGFEAFFPVYATGIGIEPWLIGLLFAAQSIIGMVVRIPVGTLFDKVSDKVPAMILGVVGNAASVALIPFFADPWILLFLMGIISVSRSGANIGGLLSVEIGSPRNQRGFAQGVATSVRNIGASAGPILFSLTASIAGFASGFVAVALIAFPASLLLMRLRGSTNHESSKNHAN